MIVLGIETSTAVCSVGLASDSGLRAEHSLVESHIHSEKLLTLIGDCSREAGITLSRIDAIAVSIGPGSFTGLRIGLSTAKGLGFSLGKPLVAISTFEALAARVFLLHLSLQKLVLYADAKQGDYYTGTYERTGDRIRETDPVHVRRLSTTWSEGKLPQTLILSDRPEEVKSAAGPSVRVDDLLRFCRGDSVAALALEKLRAGDPAGREDLEPMYLKDFIVKPARKSPA